MSARVACRMPTRKRLRSSGAASSSPRASSASASATRPSSWCQQATSLREIASCQRVAVGDRELQRVGEALAQVGDAEVAEHRARHPAREDPQGEVAGGVGDRDGGVGLLQRLGVGAGEERELRLQRRHLAARGRRSSRGVALGLGGERERAVQVAVVERDQALQRERAALEFAGRPRARRAGRAARRRVTRPGPPSGRRVRGRGRPAWRRRRRVMPRVLSAAARRT